MSIWIGVEWFQGSWLFGDFTKVDAATFNWNINEPNNIRKEHCVENWHSGVAVNNINCDARREVLCEKK